MLLAMSRKWKKSGAVMMPGAGRLRNRANGPYGGGALCDCEIVSLGVCVWGVLGNVLLGSICKSTLLVVGVGGWLGQCGGRQRHEHDED